MFHMYNSNKNNPTESSHPVRLHVKAGSDMDERFAVSAISQLGLYSKQSLFESSIFSRA